MVDVGEEARVDGHLANWVQCFPYILKSHKGLVDTVVFHIDALTGEDAEGKSSSNGLLEGIDVVNGEVLDVFLLRGGNKTVVFVDKFLQVRIYILPFSKTALTYIQVYLFPETEESKREFRELAPKLHFPLPVSGDLLGHKVQPVPSFTGRHLAYSIWSTAFAPGETVVKTIRPPADEPVASFGKVLGDRSVLYKYI